MVKCVQVKLVLGNPSRLVRWSLGLCGTLVLAGCSTVVPQGAPVNAPPVVAPPVSSELPTDVGRHRVALLVPMTGQYASAGQSIANAANMAVLDTGGQTIRVTTYDTANGALAALQKALREGNQLILGPLLADDVRAIAPAARAAHVPVVSFSNDASVAGGGVWIMGYSPNQSIGRVVSYAHDKGVNAIAGLAASGVYGQRASTALLHVAESVGAQVVSMQNYEHNPASMAGAVAKLSGGSAYEAVMIADNGKNAVMLAPLIRRASSAPVHILGTELWSVDRTLGQSPAMQGAWYASVPDGLFNQLASKYRVRFNKAPNRVASLGYDSVLLATKIADDWRNGGAFPLNKLTDKGGFSGIDGVFRFTKDGIAERGLQVNQVTATGVTVVSPAPTSLGN